MTQKNCLAFATVCSVEVASIYWQVASVDSVGSNLSRSNFAHFLSFTT